MEYRRIGNSGLKTSTISIGNWLTYGTAVENESARAIIRRAYEAGINHFDSAIAYGNKPHEGEQVLGEFLREFPRSSYILTTKTYWKIGPSVLDQGLSRKHIFDQIDISLKALGTDYVDIFYCHRYDTETDLEETLRALDDLVASGKVRYAAVSEWTAHQIQDAAHIGRRLGLRRLLGTQSQYNMLQRQVETNGVIETLQKEGYGLIPWSPLAGGILTGKYRPGQAAPEGSRGANPRFSRFVQQTLNDPKSMERLGKLLNVSEQAGIPLSQLALAWLLTRPTVCSALIGATKLEQLEENLKAADLKLSPDLLAAIDQALA